MTKLFLGSLVYTPTPEESIALIVDVLYPPEFLNELDPNSEGGNEKRRVGIERDFLRRSEIGKLQTGRGKAGQMSAVLLVFSDSLTFKSTWLQILTVVSSL